MAKVGMRGGRGRPAADAEDEEEDEEEEEGGEEDENEPAEEELRAERRREEKPRARRSGFGRAVGVGLFLSVITIVPLTITALFLLKPGKILPGLGMAYGLVAGVAVCVALALAFAARATRPTASGDDE